MGLFARYPADPTVLRQHATELEKQMQLVTLLRGDLTRQAKQAEAAVDGDLEGPLKQAPAQAQGSADHVAACGFLAAGCLHRWAGAVEDFNTVVDRQNAAWDEAVAADRHVPEGLSFPEAAKRTAEIIADGKVPLAPWELRIFVDQAQGTLDEAAAEVKSMLEKGPTDETLQSLLDSQDLPPSTALVLNGFNLSIGGIPAPLVTELRKALGELPPEVRYLVEGLVNIPGDLEKFMDIAGGLPGLIEALNDKQRMAELMDKAMQDPDIARDIYNLFGFEYNAEGDYYTTGEHSVQSLGGFSTWMDEIGHLLGMDLQDQTMYYTGKDGHQYRLELWKGSYGFGSAYGGEQGLYRAPDLGDHSGDKNYNYKTVTGDDQVHFSQTLVNKKTGEEFTNDAAGADGQDKEHFWNLAIRSHPGTKPEDIQQVGHIQANDAETAESIYHALQQQVGKPGHGTIRDVTYDPATHTVSYVWD